MRVVALESSTKRQLAENLIQCVRTKKCSFKSGEFSLVDCWCGPPGAAQDACVAGTTPFPGDCKAEIEAAAETTVAADIGQRMTDDTYGIGLAYKALNVAFKGWRDVAGTSFGAPLKGGSIAAEVSPELLGVGYIIGMRVSSWMFAGGFITYMVLIPLIMFFGSHVEAVLPPGTTGRFSAPDGWQPAEPVGELASGSHLLSLRPASAHRATHPESPSA